MKPISVLAGFATALALCMPAAAADKAKEQAEIQKAAKESIDKFYKKKPAIEGEVKAAPGYAIFRTYGLSFVVGGSGGGGVARDPKAGKDTYMKMAQASAGLQAGAGEKDVLIIFKSKGAFDNFVEKGWEFGGAGAVSAGVAGKTAGGGSGQQEINDATTYTLTRNGLDVGGALQGTKFWKDKDLN